MKTPAKQRVLWFKQRMPTVVRDGTSLVTMNMVECLAEVFDVDLVTLRLTGREDKAVSKVCPPFESVHIVQPDNSGSIITRGFYRALYEVIAIIRGVPRPILYASGRNTIDCLQRVFAANKYSLAVFEYYTSAPLAKIANCPTVLLLIDATYKTLEDACEEKCGISRLLANYRAAIMRRFEARAPRLADHCFAISERDISLLQQAGNQCPINYLPVLLPPVVRRQIKTAAFPGGSEYRVAFIGNLAYEENSRALVWFIDHVWPRIRASVPSAKLNVFGGGRDHLPLSYHSVEGVRYVGWVDDLGESVAQCDCGVAPSVSGTGVKIKVLEMMVNGLPVIATSIAAAGTPAACGGALVADDPAAFAQRVVDVLRDPVLRAGFREKAWQLMDANHCGDQVRQRVQEIFRGLCAS